MKKTTKKALNALLKEVYSFSYPRLNEYLTDRFIKHSFSLFKKEIMSQFNKKLDADFFNELKDHINGSVYCSCDDEAKKIFKRHNIDILKVVEYTNFIFRNNYLGKDKRQSIIKPSELLNDIYQQTFYFFLSTLENKALKP